MLRFIARNRKHSIRNGLHRANLRLERLEGRDCPSPVLTGVNSRLIGSTLVVTGRVQDTNPTSDTVAVSGIASGSVRFLDSQGDFEFISSSGISAGWLRLTATGTDSSGGDIENYYVNADTGHAAPYISITGITYHHQRSITITGEVIAENPAGLTITISGVASGAATTDSNGNFSATLTASALGNVNAQTSDANGQSNVATELLSAPAPVIDEVIISEAPGNSFTISGHVTCPDPQGLTVTLGGDVPALAGQQVTVDANGWFHITVTVPPGQNGTVTAQTTDWWGQQSNVATDTLIHSNN
ncbi:MAG TPA: hypothetical protein VGZ47_14685 [Gemmataceae bacterium]|jgi:hypothetical protein|nr:hypothetical protein [Gemmataceae bacterium]